MDWQELPKSLVEVAEEVGVVNALALAGLYGGHRLYISPRFPEDHPIVKFLGREVADKLSARFGTEYIEMAKCRELKLRERNQELYELREQRVKVADLARKFHLGERQVYLILSQRKSKRDRRPANLTPSDQLEMFRQS